jgi:hypothetical protein
VPQAKEHQQGAAFERWDQFPHALAEPFGKALVRGVDSAAAELFEVRQEHRQAAQGVQGQTFAGRSQPDSLECTPALDEPVGRGRRQ